MKDELEEQETQGSFSSVGRMDILTTVLGTPEHGGRVRGAGRGVGIKQFFGSVSFARSQIKPTLTEDDIKAIKDKLRGEMMADIEQELMPKLRADIMAEFATLSGQVPTTPVVPTSRGMTSKASCDSPDMSHPTIPDIDPDCRLYIRGPPERLVALGMYSNFLYNIFIDQFEVTNYILFVHQC